MAATRRTAAKRRTPAKPASTLRGENERLQAQVDKIRNGSYCYMCGQVKTIQHFYADTDPNVTNNRKITSSAARICKQCYQGLVHGNLHGGPSRPVTKQSLKKGLYYLNKPYIEDVYHAAVEMANKVTPEGRQSTDPSVNYMTQINSLPQYYGMTWLDSDMFKVINGGRTLVEDQEDEPTEQEVIEGHMGEDVYDSFVKNRNDVQRLLGYDPFAEEAVKDQPFLYSQLLGMLDQSEDQNQDMMRVSSAISIVRDFLQLSKIDDSITRLMSSTQTIAENAASIKSLQDSKQKITSVITNLATQSCLSLNHSKNTTKGENTWTGKVRKIRELNLRDGEVNGFDIATSKAMRQVMDASNKSIIHELKCDDSEWASMVADQRDMIYKIDSELSDYKEIARILLRENIDLKDYLKDNNVKYDGNLIDLDELFQDSRTYIIEHENTEEVNGKPPS